MSIKFLTYKKSFACQKMQIEKYKKFYLLSSNKFLKNLYVFQVIFNGKTSNIF